MPFRFVNGLFSYLNEGQALSRRSWTKRAFHSRISVKSRTYRMTLNNLTLSRPAPSWCWDIFTFEFCGKFSFNHKARSKGTLSQTKRRPLLWCLEEKRVKLTMYPSHSFEILSGQSLLRQRRTWLGNLFANPWKDWRTTTNNDNNKNLAVPLIWSWCNLPNAVPFAFFASGWFKSICRGKKIDGSN